MPLSIGGLLRVSAKHELADKQAAFVHVMNLPYVPVQALHESMNNHLWLASKGDSSPVLVTLPPWSVVDKQFHPVLNKQKGR